jgi:Protein of unknown function (DUF3137)
MTSILAQNAETDLWAQARGAEVRAIRWRWRLIFIAALALIAALAIWAIGGDGLNPASWIGFPADGWRPFGEFVPLTFGQIFALVLAFAALQATHRAVRWGYEQQAGAAVVPQITAMPGAAQYSSAAADAFDIARLHDLGLLPYYDRQRVRHALTGQHRAIAFRLGELRLMRRTGGKNRRLVEAFRGLLLRIDAPAPNASHVLVMQGAASRAADWINNALDAVTGAETAQRAQTGDAAFDARFSVYADLPDMAARTLTKQAREALTQLADSDVGPGMSAIFTGNALTLALPARPLLFDAGPLWFGGSLERRIAMAVDSARLPQRVIEMWRAAGA